MIKTYMASVVLTDTERHHVEKALQLGYPMEDWAREHFLKSLAETLRQGPKVDVPPVIEYFDSVTEDDRHEFGRADSPTEHQLQGYCDLIRFLEPAIRGGWFKLGEYIEEARILGEDKKRTVVPVKIFGKDFVIF